MPGARLVHDMNERRATILNLVAETYIETAHPVASGRVAEHLELSSATVRNEFAALEEEGYLHQPHTSAGRVPTPTGFRVYAAAFLPPHRLPAAQRRLVQARLQGAHGEALLARIASLAAELSGYAVVVSLPADEALRTLEVHLSLLSGRHLLAFVVLENGLVRQFPVDVDPAPGDDVIDDAERSLRQLTLPARDVPPALEAIAAGIGGDLARTLRAVAAAWPAMSPPRLVADGLKNVLGEPEARDPDFVRRVVEQVESGQTDGPGVDGIALLLDEALARVSTTMDLFGSSRGTLMLVGPARLRYAHALMVVSGVRDAVGTAAQGDDWGQA